MATGSVGHDVLGTTGLFLNVGAVISMAVWLGTVAGGLPGGSAAVIGIVTIVLFASGWTCFAADRPRDPPPDRQ